MIQIEHKQNCAGCTSCMASCPKNAITMEKDGWGFQYPSIDMKKCVNCGLCDKVCPFVQSSSAKLPIQEVYAVKHRDAEILKESTSGGIFTAISDYVLEQGGVVYGAAFDENMVVRHMRATTPEQRNRMRGSKYVQSDMGDIFTQVKQDIIKKKKVLFTGTPCQVAGLKNFLKNATDGLICLDLICHGVPSPVIYKEHLNFLSEKMKMNVLDYKFRPKDWGWHIHREIVYGEKRYIIRHHIRTYGEICIIVE